MVGFLPHQDYLAVVLRVFARYLELARRLQRMYQLEPAGSHGVWSLDDYRFLSRLSGNVQLRDYPRLKPIAAMDAQQVEDYAPDYMYFRTLQSIHKVYEREKTWIQESMLFGSF
jgi:serine/threonine-protein phosphatase 2A activator